jgi:hypothetical protein
VTGRAGFIYRIGNLMSHCGNCDKTDERENEHAHRPLRLNQVAAYSGQNGCNEECAGLSGQFGNEKRFFVMAIT